MVGKVGDQMVVYQVEVASKLEYNIELIGAL